ncbi:MAG: DUF4292 domain-containing protein [Bacteroidetes bacterium]|nr:DUF4292 domain-containing protein [Bacteroidota bacterium]
MGKNNGFSKGYFMGLVALVIMFSVSCSPARKAIRAPIKEEGSEYLFKKLKEHELKYTYFMGKFSAEYKNQKKSTSFNGQIRIKKDSVIWLSLTPGLGIEAMRLIITQDSVKMINKLNNTFYLGDYEAVNHFLNTNIDFDILQAYLLGNDLQFYEDGKFRVTIENNSYKLSTAARMKLKKYVRNSQENARAFIQNIWLDSETFKITEADVKEISNEKIKVEAGYGDFENIDGQLFPKALDVTIWADNTIKVKASFSRITVDSPMQFPFRIPTGYTQVK